MILPILLKNALFIIHKPSYTSSVLRVYNDRCNDLDFTTLDIPCVKPSRSLGVCTSMVYWDFKVRIHIWVSLPFVYKSVFGHAFTSIIIMILSVFFFCCVYKSLTSYFVKNYTR